MKTAAEILTDLENATAAAFTLARAMMVNAEAARADDDEWTRIPAPKAKCPVSRWSRSTILRQIAAGKIRSKHTRGGRFYPLKIVRLLLRSGADPRITDSRRRKALDGFRMQ